MMENLNRLEEIKRQMEDLVQEAECLLRDHSRETGDHMIYERAKAYWIAHIKCNIGDDNYPTYSTTMSESINDIRDLAMHGEGSDECSECGEPLGSRYCCE